MGLLSSTVFALKGTISLDGVDETQDQLSTTATTAEGSSSKMISAFGKIGAAVAAAFTVDKIVQFGEEIVTTAAEVDAQTSAFEQIMGSYTDAAYEKMQGVADSTGIVSTRLTDSMTSLTAKFKGLGYDVSDATDLAARGLNIAADASAFWDVSLDDSMSHLNSFINGSYEGGEAIGLFANDTQMAAYAVQQGIVKSTSDWSKLDEATKQATRLEYAENMMEQSGATGQAAKEAGQYANVQANLTEKWRQFKAQIGEDLLNKVVVPAMTKLGDLLPVISEKFQAISDWIKEHSGLITGVLTALAVAIGIVTTAIAMQTAVQAIKAAMNATEATSLSALIAAKMADAAASLVALAPYLLIAAAIAALIAIIVLLVKNWNKVKEVASNVWQSIKEAWGAVGDWFSEHVSEPLKNVWQSIKDAWGAVGDWFREHVIEPLKNVWQSVQEAWGTVGDWLSEHVIEPLKNALQSIRDWFSEHITTPISNFWQTYFQPAVDKIVDICQKLVEIVQALFTGLFNLLMEKLTPVFDWINTTVIQPVQDAITTLVDKAKTILQNVYNKIRYIFLELVTFFTKIWLKIQGVFSTVEDFFSGIFYKAYYKIRHIFGELVSFLMETWVKIKSVFNSVAEFFRSIFQTAYNKVTSIFNKLVTFFSNVWSKIKNTFTKLGTSISSAIGGAVKKGINGVISMIQNTINKAISLINGAIGLINKLPGVSVSKISKLSLPRLASGTVAYEPMVAEFGEYSGARRNPEIVSPRNIMAETFRDVLNETYKTQAGTAGNAAVVDKLDELIDTMKALKIYLDTGTLVGEMAPQMDSALGDINRRRLRGI